MTDDESWRRRRAEELRLFDSKPPFGPPNNRPTPRALPRCDPDLAVDGVAPMQRPEAPAPATTPVGIDPQRPQGTPPAGVIPLPPDHDGRSARVEPRRRSVAGVAAPHAPSSSASPSNLQWLAFAVPAAMIVAASVGWLIHDEVDVAPRPPLKIAAVADRDRGADPAAAPLAEPQVLPEPPMVPEPAPPVLADRPAGTLVANRAAALERSPPVVARWSSPATAVALPGRSFKPSFNCRRATAVVNRMICADRTLADLDNAMSERFYTVVRSVDARAAERVSEDQVDFLNRRARCRTPDCIADLYRRRIDRLDDTVRS